MKKKENLSLNFGFQGIKTEQFATFPDRYNAKKVTGLSTTLEFKVNTFSGLVGCFIQFDFIQGKNVFITIEVSCHFLIEENSFNLLKDTQKKQVKIPKDFLTHLAILSVGTARGVLFSKTEGTIFSTFILPTINLQEMINEDAIFDLE